ncbi:MAG: glycosyltransferase family 4 protein [Magnetococcales bacterium]|nr:glycosyltransferase family 4 protein [Magnetococcales bacterium]
MTSWQKKKLLEKGINKQIVVIPNPLSCDFEKIVRQEIPTKNSSGRINILTMARVVEGKGVDLAVEAMAFLPPSCQMTVAGDGDLLPTLKKRVHSLGIADRVHFVGWLRGAKKKQFLSDADLFCLPSQLDSFGMVFMEAMSFGLPVIALGNGPICDVVPHGQAGTLVDQPHPQQIAAAILPFLENPEKRRHAGEGGKRWVVSHYSAKEVGNKLLALCQA